MLKKRKNCYLCCLSPPLPPAWPRTMSLGLLLQKSGPEQGHGELAGLSKPQLSQDTQKAAGTSP